MKLRLSAHEMVVRMSETEYQRLKDDEILSERFWLSPTRQMKVTLKAAGHSGIQFLDEEFVLEIPFSEFQAQRTKKDSAWEIFAGEALRILVEVDLAKPRRFEKEV